MNINILYDKSKMQTFYSDIFSEYEKRLTNYCKLKYINNYTDSCKSMYLVLICLGAKVQNSFSNNNPREFSSVEFSDYIVNLGVSGKSDILFLLQNDENEKLLSDLEMDINDRLIISSLDLNPKLSVIILLEQLYRSFRIINNEPYHK